MFCARGCASIEFERDRWEAQVSRAATTKRARRNPAEQCATSRKVEAEGETETHRLWEARVEQAREHVVRLRDLEDCMVRVLTGSADCGRGRRARALSRGVGVRASGNAPVPSGVLPYGPSSDLSFVRASSPVSGCSGAGAEAGRAAVVEVARWRRRRVDSAAAAGAGGSGASMVLAVYALLWLS